MKKEPKNIFSFIPADRGERVQAATENSARVALSVVFLDKSEKNTSFLDYAQSVRVFAYYSRPLKRNKAEAEKLAAEWLALHSGEFKPGRVQHIAQRHEEKFAFEFVRIEKTADKPKKTRKARPAATLPILPPLNMQPSPAIRHHAAPCSLACAADMLNMRKFKYPDRKTGLMQRLDLRGVGKCTTWRALHDENGILQYTTEKDENGKPHRVYKFRHIAESFLIFSASLDNSAAMKSCNGGNIAGFNGRNPERICSMAALWGLTDISGQLFRTPADWQKAGYELKDTARPFFVVTPKFTEKTEKETDEETGEEIDKITITGSSGQYNLFPVYCSADVVQVRTVKRRAPREKKADTELDALATAYKAARQELPPVVHPADREHMRQMALAL